MPTAYFVEYAISLGIEKRDGLWKMQFIHPLDAMSKQTAWLPLAQDDTRIGTKIDGVQVAKPGTRMVEILGLMYEKITSYPYYWPYEGNSVDRYGYDFEVQMSVTESNAVSNIEITQIAYDIVRKKLGVQVAGTGTHNVYNQNTYLLESGGAYVKYTVTLDKAKPVSEITITPFTEYDLEIVSIMYEEDIETFHPMKELLAEEIVVDESGNSYSKIPASDVSRRSSTRTMQFKFASIIARRFTFILRQKNYTKNTYLIRGQEVNKKELWDKISSREAEVTLDITDGLNTVEEEKISAWTGWDIYLQQLQKHKKDHSEWAEKMKAYRVTIQAIADKEKERAVEEVRFKKLTDEYRAEYNEALKKYNERVAQHEKEMEAYNTAKANYDRDLALYNKYLRDLKEWKSTWG